jgi:hypothetical protein
MQQSWGNARGAFGCHSRRGKVTGGAVFCGKSAARARLTLAEWPGRTAVGAT